MITCAFKMILSTGAFNPIPGFMTNHGKLAVTLLYRLFVGANNRMKSGR